MTITRPSGSLSSSGPRSGAGRPRRRSARAAWRWSTDCWRSTPSTGCGRPKACSGCGRPTPRPLEAACLKALAVGDPSYRTVKGILVAALENTPAPPTAGDGGAAAFLHGPDQLFADVVPLPTRPAAGGGGTPPPQGDPAQPEADTPLSDAAVDVLPFDVLSFD